MRLGTPRAVAVLFASAVLCTTSQAAPHPEAIPDSDGERLVTPAWTPYGLGNQAATVMLKLTGDPVAIRQANAGRKLTRQEKEAAKAQLRAQQAALRPAIEALGGTVLGSYQVAYNGIKVLIARNQTANLAALPGVTAVRPVPLMEPHNVRGSTLIGTPAVWQSLGIHGEGVKVAIIDTGVDYTHATFGGPGTAAAYEAAHEKETLPADPALFGPAAPRVKGGIDLVGDTYKPNAGEGFQPIPKPDPNPLDCNGHGSHVAGTAAGSGVTSGGATYTGPYDGSTLPGSFSIGPGVAPRADIYAVRVFGCEGSTNVVVDAIEWSVDNEMDVINMSLGSPFGEKEDVVAEASTNAAKAGVIVVASAGNNGAQQYITGSPASADGAISVAANDAAEGFPGARLTLPTGAPITAINANDHPLAATATYTIRTIADNPATPDRDESLGCSVADFGGPLPPNTLAVVNRGICARVAKAIFGQQAGAAAVAMVNNATVLPPFEGPITSNPDDGTPFTVTIPFLGVRGLPTTTGSDGFRLRAANGASTTVTPFFIVNTNFKGFASFSSGGPRTGDSRLKPEITAPGVNVVSALVGSGNGPLTISGTSMAAPHVAGVAALTRQAKPTWSVADIKASIMNTGLPSGASSTATAYRITRGGTGLVQPAASTATQVVARANGDKLLASLDFGLEELKGDFSKTKEILLENNGSTDATFNVARANAAGRPHTVSFGASSVTVPAHGKVGVEVTVNVPAATAGSGTGFHEVAGLVQFTPASASDNGGATLRVPYVLVPRTQSDISTTLGVFSGTNPTTTATVTNVNGVVAGSADFYAWGLDDHRDMQNKGTDVRAVGVQSFAFGTAAQPTRRLLVFAVNTYGRWSNASTNEFDISVDVDNDGEDDYVVVGVDLGAVQTGVFSGQMGAFVFSTRSPGANIAFLATAPTDSSTVLLPVLTTHFCRPPSGTPEEPIIEPCLSQAANPRISYRAVGFDLFNGTADVVNGPAKFNVWSSSISQGGFATVAPGATASVPIAVNSAEWAVTPALGVMVVTFDNKSGASEAQLIKPIFE